MFQGLWFFVKFSWRHDRKYIAYLVLAQLADALLPLVGIILPKFIIDELMGPQRPGRLALLAGALIGVVFLLKCASACFHQESFTRRCRIGAEFDLFIDRKLYQADFVNLESAGFQDMKQRAQKFLYADWHGFSYLLDSALSIVGQSFVLLGVAALVARMNPLIVLAFSCLSLAASGVELWARKRQMALNLQVASDQRGWSHYSHLFEDVAYGKEIRVSGAGEWLLAKQRAFTQRANENIRRQNNYFKTSGKVDALSAMLTQGTAYAYLMGRVIQGAMGIGDFTMFVGAAGSFSGAVRTVMHALVDIKTYGAYYEALQAYLSIPNDLYARGKRTLSPGPHVLTLENVGFRYPGQQGWALRAVNLTLKQGEKLSVVGENGAGKTTFIKLLLRIYQPTEGRILLDGVDILEYDCSAYLGAFAAVLQDFKLFALTLKENVCLQRSGEADDREVARILRQVGLGEKLDRLPLGVHTPVYKTFDEGGFEPSGGEGQKIALARALYRDAPILILDEPTAAMDPRAECEMYAQFDRLVQGKLAVYISHRLSSARFCDRIAVFERGSIVELGSHRQLMAREGVYAGLFRMQAHLYDG